VAFAFAFRNVMASAEFAIPGPAGNLQLIEDRPEGEVKALAVVCHPHPLHGGTFKNKVVHMLARAFVELGAVTIRFNFRGVGTSQGEYAHGRGERQDLEAVVGWLRQRWPSGMRLWLGGFSFGGAVALNSVHSVAADWLVTVAPAINHVPADALPPGAVPWLLIQGGDDDVVPTRQVVQWVETLQNPPRVALLDGAGHFFHGRLAELKRAVLEAAVA
jgi:alpha/beta superfamily hydrolase